MKHTTTKTAAATMTSLLAASGAQGAIQYFDSSNQFSAGLGLNTEVLWDIDGVNGADAVWSLTVGGSYLYLANHFVKDFGGVAPTGGDLKNLASGYTVSAGRVFDPFFSLIYSGVLSEVNGFSTGVEGSFGFRFNNGSGLKYGWADVTFVDGANGGVTVHEWAFQDDGSSINVGQTAVPEPATTALGLGALALGAAGLRRWRKAKQAA